MNEVLKGWMNGVLIYCWIDEWLIVEWEVVKPHVCLNYALSWKRNESRPPCPGRWPARTWKMFPKWEKLISIYFWEDDLLPELYCALFYLDLTSIKSNFSWHISSFFDRKNVIIWFPFPSLSFAFILFKEGENWLLNINSLLKIHWQYKNN